MRFSFALLLSCLSTGVLAGGIRGAYERMFIWYVYQAHITDLDWRYSSVDDIEILRDGFGTAKPHGTLTFNEFIEYVNRPRNAKPGTIPSVSNSRTPEVSNCPSTRRPPSTALIGTTTMEVLTVNGSLTRGALRWRTFCDG